MSAEVNYIFMVLIIVLIVVSISRELICWLIKSSEVVSKQEEIIKELKEINSKLNKYQKENSPNRDKEIQTSDSAII